MTELPIPSEWVPGCGPSLSTPLAASNAVTSRCIVADNVVALADAMADELPDPDHALQRCERSTVVHKAAAEMRETDQKVLSLMMDERAYDYREISTISGRPIGSLGPTRDRIIRKLRTNAQVAQLMAV